MSAGNIHPDRPRSRRACETRSLIIRQTVVETESYYIGVRGATGNPRSRRRAKLAIVQMVGWVAWPHPNLASQRQSENGGGRGGTILYHHCICVFIYEQ